MPETTPPHIDNPELTRASQILHFKVLEHKLEKIWTDFAANGFEPILIKGWAAAQLYAEKHERGFSDVDLAFAPGDFARAREFASKQTFPLLVDLHRGLRHLDTVPFEVLFARSRLVKLSQTKIRLLAPEDHLRVLAVHWLNDGGAPRQRLWDIYYAVDSREEDFSWERCLGGISVKRRRWIVCAIGLAHRYLDLPIDDLPFKAELNNLPPWLIKTVEREWASGVRLMALEYCRHDRRELWRQIKKRIPPNALQATIETEGDFDSLPRIYYQTLDVFKRLAPWLGFSKK